MDKKSTRSTRIAELEQRIQQCEQERKKIINALQNLKNKVLARELSISQYNEITQKKKEGKTFAEWIAYYDSYIADCQKRIAKESDTLVVRKIALVSCSVFILLSLTFLLFKAQPLFQGFATQEYPQQFTDAIDQTFTSNTSFTWQPRSGSLQALKLSGQFKGEGNVKIFLDDIIIFDSDDLDRSLTASPLTGSVIAEEEIPQLELNESILEVANETQTENQTIEQLAPEIQEPTPQTPTITIPLTDYCTTSCDLTPYALDKSEYTIRVEVDNAELALNTITYDSIVPITEEQNQTIPSLELRAKFNTEQKEQILQESTTGTNISVSTVQLPAEVGKPVRWQMRFAADAPLAATLVVPPQGTNVSLTKEDATQEDVVWTFSPSITANVVQGGSFATRFKNLFTLTGRAIDSDVQEQTIDLEFTDATEEYVLEYTTPAPTALVEQISNQKTRVIISSPQEVHYTDVLSSAELPRDIPVGREKQIKLHWIEEDSYLDFIPTDSDNDGLIDAIQWIAPHLSNQTFEIIIITSAQHLDADRNFIEDIFDSVSQLDGNYSVEIPDTHFVRVTFERNLSSLNDITLYPLILSGTPIIEVYEQNQTNLLATFNPLINDSYNRIILSNLDETQDVFDLKISAGSVKFDHIIDPPVITSTILLPHNNTQNVTSGTMTEITNPEGVNPSPTTGVRITNTCYAQINRTGEGATCLESGGSATLDAFFMWNITLPEYSSITRINITSIAAKSANVVENLSLALFNFTSGTWRRVNNSVNPALGANTTLTYSIDSTRNGSFVSGRLVQVISYTQGGANSDILQEHFRVNITYFPLDLAPAVTLQAPANASTVIALRQTFNATITDETALVNMTLFIWNQTDLFNSTTRTLAGATTFANITVTLGNPGIYTWTYESTDDSNQIARASSNFTFTYDPYGIVACAVLNTSGQIYNQYNNIVPNSGSSCINITVSNVTFEGNGFAIANNTYNAAAIYAFNVSNITIADANLSVGTSIGGRGVYFRFVNGSTIQHTRISTSFYGINFQFTNDTLINNITSPSVGMELLQIDYSNRIKATNIMGLTGADSGLAINGTNSSMFANLTFTGFFEGIVSQNEPNGNVFTGLNFTGGTYGMYLNAFGNNNRFNDVIIRDLTSGEGISSGSDVDANNTFSNITLINNLIAINYFAGRFNKFYEITLKDNIEGLNFIEDAYNFTVQNLYINNTRRNHAIEIVPNNGFNPTNVTLANITIENTNTSYYDLIINNSLVEIVRLVDIVKIQNYSILNISKVVFQNSLFGEIKFLSTINQTGTNFSADVVFRNNSVFINGSRTGLNRSANVTLYNLPTTFINPAIYKDGALCGSACYNFTSLNAGTVLFNVTSWSNYSIQESASNTAPQIIEVTELTSLNPLENTVSNLMFNVTVYDADGFTDLKFTSAQANASRAGESTRSDIACINIANYSSTFANFSCSIGMWYFDESGVWNISVSINDSNNLQAVNTTNFTYNVLTSFVMSPSLTTFATINPGAFNTTSNNDPLLLNNTGNNPITAGNIQLNATDLMGETDTNIGLYATNFSIGLQTGSNAECYGPNVTVMNRSFYQPIVNATLPRGNNSIGDGVTGQEQLYVCLRYAGNELSAQSYSTLTQGSWTLRILVVALTLSASAKKRKKIQSDRIVKTIKLLLEENEAKPSLKVDTALAFLYEEVEKKYNITRDELNEVLSDTLDKSVPITIFTKEVGALEALCNYLKAERKLKYSQIAQLLRRDDRTVWTACKKASEKYPVEFAPTPTKTYIPLQIFAQDELTVLEALIFYLKNQGLRYSEIGALLNRDQRNVWVIYARVIKRQGRKV